MSVVIQGHAESTGTALLVEDDQAMARTLAAARELLDQAQRNQIPTDLIVLDLGLPDVDGLILCTPLRRMADVPIIICSARTQRVDKIISLKLGADAFIG